MTTKDDELDALKARIEELERKAEPAKPFVPEPWTPIDRTAGMTMPRSALQEMVNAVPDHVLRGIVRDNQAPQGPSGQGVVPSSQQITGLHPGGGPADTSGWREAAPLGPPPGIQWVDALCIADDVKQRK
jgi:hypothetical protein